MTEHDEDAVVERMARALFEHEYNPDGDYRWPEAGDEEKEKHRRRARAAISAQMPGDRLPVGLMLVPAWFADMVEDTQPLRAAIKREQKRLARFAASTD